MRTLLLMLLVCAVPATALAGVMHRGDCPRASHAIAAGHAGHAMHADPSQHAQHHAAQRASPDDHSRSNADACQCGCACSGMAHCGAGAGISVGDRGAVPLAAGAALRPTMPRSGQALAGHSRDFLRPPSMS
ncbi:MAG: hypothetical protein WC809_16420 [Sinimarinibacterium sp.]